MKTTPAILAVAALCGCVGPTPAPVSLVGKTYDQLRQNGTLSESRFVGRKEELARYDFRGSSALLHLSNAVVIAVYPSSANEFELAREIEVSNRRKYWLERNADAPESIKSKVLSGALTMEKADYLSSQEMSALTAAKQCKVDRDDFKKVTSVTGPNIPFPEGEKQTLLTTPLTKYCYLSAQKSDADNSVTYFLVLSINGFTWSHWDEVVDDLSNRMNLRLKGSDVISGNIVNERAYAVLSRDVLGIWSTRPTKVRAYGKQTEDFIIPPGVVAGFLQKCDQSFAVSLQR